jgi:anthranilate synthase component 1
VRLADLPRFIGGAVGYLSYDAVRRFERLPDNNPDELHLPEAAFMIAHTLVVFDHARQRLQVVANADLTRGISAPPISERPHGLMRLWLA